MRPALLARPLLARPLLARPLRGRPHCARPASLDRSGHAAESGGDRLPWPIAVPVIAALAAGSWMLLGGLLHAALGWL